MSPRYFIFRRISPQVSLIQVTKIQGPNIFFSPFFLCFLDNQTGVLVFWNNFTLQQLDYPFIAYCIFPKVFGKEINYHPAESMKKHKRKPNLGLLTLVLFFGNGNLYSAKPNVLKIFSFYVSNNEEKFQDSKYNFFYFLKFSWQSNSSTHFPFSHSSSFSLWKTVIVGDWVFFELVLANQIR